MDQTFDKMFFGKCHNLAGIDEVGVTALSGPIVASCVVLPRLKTTDDLSLFLIDDSKKIREKYRKQASDIIKEQALAYGIGIVYPKEIDALNLEMASNLAMKRAVKDCENRCNSASPDFCLVDGNREIDLGVPHCLIVKGDLKSLSIAAASILAKVHRDSMMEEYHKIRPEYDFSHNKGYKCDAHFKGLDQSGIWIGVHRVSMFPIAKKKEDDKVWKARRKLWGKQTEIKLLGGNYEKID